MEFGRSLNLVTIPGLKGAGDVKFPVFYGIFSMWCIMVAGAWIFGIVLGFGLPAIILAIGMDETNRGNRALPLEKQAVADEKIA